MSVNLKNAAEVLTACAFALLLLPPFKGRKTAGIVVGAAWGLLAVLLIIDSFSASA